MLFCFLGFLTSIDKSVMLINTMLIEYITEKI